MSEQKILYIRETIALAQKQEASNHELQSYLESSVASLHHLISLPEENSSETLMDFVTRYINHVPDFIEALSAYLHEAEIYDETKVLLDIAVEFFTKPPEIVSNHSGMHALIDEAYLAHRLIEEINDRLVASAGNPLLPMDMTFSNLIIHSLIGDEFANQLDLVVHYAIELLFSNERLAQLTQNNKFLAEQSKQGWKDAFDRWPCLAGDSAISLKLSDSLDDDNPIVH